MLAAVDIGCDVPSLLIRQGVALPIGHVRFDEPGRRRDPCHPCSPIVGARSPKRRDRIGAVRIRLSGTIRAVAGCALAGVDGRATLRIVSQRRRGQLHEPATGERFAERRAANVVAACRRSGRSRLIAGVQFGWMRSARFCRFVWRSPVSAPRTARAAPFQVLRHSVGGHTFPRRCQGHGDPSPPRPVRRSGPHRSSP